MIRRKKKTQQQREGAAVIEFAVCLPVILLIVLGTIEAGNMLFLKQTLVQAAYEGAKVAIVTGDTERTEASINAVAAGRNIQNLEVEFVPTNLADAVPGQTISVIVSAPGDTNSIIPFGPFRNRIVRNSTSMVRE